MPSSVHSGANSFVKVGLNLHKFRENLTFLMWILSWKCVCALDMVLWAALRIRL